MFQNLSSREKTMLLSLAVFLIVSVFYIFLLRPQLDSYTESADKLKQMRGQLQTAEAALRARKEEEKKFAEFQTTWKECAANLDTEYRRGSALVLLGLKAANLNVTINKLLPGGIIDKKDYLELPLVLEVEGEYQNVKQLLNEIETLSNIVEIRALKATTSKQATGSKVPGQEDQLTSAACLVNVQCDITVYSAPHPVGKLDLEEEKAIAWQLGRENPFAQPGPVSPYPEVPVPVINNRDENGTNPQDDKTQTLNGTGELPKTPKP